MAKLKKKLGAKKFADFFRLIEAEADLYPVELLPITSEENGSTTGILLLDTALPQTEKSKLLKAIQPAGSKPQKSKSPLALLRRQSGLPGRETFENNVRNELARVKTCRLPCALLLIKVDGLKEKQATQKAVAAFKTEVPANAHLAHYDETTFSLLLPGHNKKRTLRHAQSIRGALSKSLSHPVSIGLTICLARNIPPAETFIKMAEKELHKSKQEGEGIFHSLQQTEDDSCQVTAEERAQLFSFLTGGKKE